MIQFSFGKVFFLKMFPWMGKISIRDLGMSVGFAVYNYSQAHGNILKSHVLQIFNFFQRLLFQSHCYLKLTLFTLQNYHEFLRIVLCGELYRFGGTNTLDLTNFQIQAQHKKLPKEHVTYTWLLHFDRLCNYWYSFQTKAIANFFININCCFPDQGKINHYTSIFTATKNNFMRFLLPLSCFLFKSN